MSSISIREDASRPGNPRRSDFTLVIKCSFGEILADGKSQVESRIVRWGVSHATLVEFPGSIYVRGVVISGRRL
jgi:hypothetical protein